MMEITPTQIENIDRWQRGFSPCLIVTLITGGSLTLLNPALGLPTMLACLTKAASARYSNNELLQGRIESLHDFFADEAVMSTVVATVCAVATLLLFGTPITLTGVLIWTAFYTLPSIFEAGLCAVMHSSKLDGFRSRIANNLS